MHFLILIISSQAPEVKQTPSRKGSDLQQLMEETEDTAEPEEDNKDKKAITIVEAQEMSKGQSSLISGEGTEKILSVQSEEVDPADEFAVAVKLA